MRRRAFLTTVAAGTLTGCLGGGETSSDAIAGTWPQRRVDARNSAHLAGGAGPRTEPAERWRTAFDSTPQAEPVVRDGRTYLPLADETVALDTATGEVSWSADSEAATDATLAASGQRILCPGADGVLRSRSPVDGAEQWAFDAGSSLVTAVTTTGPVATVGSEDGRLHTVDASGRRRWAVELGGRPVTTPAVHGGLSYVGTDAGELVSLAAGSGEVEWRADVGGDPDDPVVAGDLVLTTVADELFALDAETGQEIRRLPAGSEVFGSPAVVDGARLFAGRDGSLRSLAPGGEPNWAADVAATSIPVVAGGTVYVGTGSGVAAVALTGGEVRWEADLGSAVSLPVVALDRRVLAVTDQGAAVVLEA
ncbi:PQQ-binding-like beta-propeller repeat protein [Haloarchaeobius sp. TZWWS8]|uniref:outer membrane protein assembly factor BamB family protein n=1 Tax=Haloarchaeobius sp. TZWWS8 TaxID=3446121 RepID=UPI003EBAD330